ncbi:MAG: DUF3106 domain-containing protein [Betaproteobacteria bacterium]|nr:DUF3106 domain-containing protein [Betaproteobacteria bacterium]
MDKRLFRQLIGLWFWVGLAYAQPVVPPAAPAAAPHARAPARAPHAAPLSWYSLTPQQRTVLAPVSREWNGLPLKLRRSFVVVANRYPRMSPEQQEHVRANLIAWSRLTPQQRALARKNYERLRRLTPAQRRALKLKWLRRHRELLRERRELKIREKAAARRPAGAVTPSAASTRPVAPAAPRP